MTLVFECAFSEVVMVAILALQLNFVDDVGIRILGQKALQNFFTVFPQ